MFYFVIGGILLVLSIVLFVFAAIDIYKNKKDKSLLALLLVVPTIGPLIYFQTKNGILSHKKFDPKFHKRT